MVHVVAALIWSGDRFMICQRPENKARALLWEYVGGKVEPGETPEQAVVREIQEELNTRIEVVRHMDTVESDYPAFHMTMDCYLCRIIDGHLELREHEAARWLTKETLFSVDWLPADLKFVREKVAWLWE